MEATLKFAVPSIGELRITKMLFDFISSKLSTALRQAVSASVHNSFLANSELTTSQCVLLALLRSLQTGDLPFCAILLQLPTIDSLKSPYITIWLRDEFNFDEIEVVRALSLAAQLVHTGSLNIPEHVLRLLAALTTKYHVFEHCRKSGDLDTINLLTELNTPISRGQQTDFEETSTSMSIKQSASTTDIQTSAVMTVTDDTSVASSIEVHLESEVAGVENVALDGGPGCSSKMSEIAGAEGGLENDASSSADGVKKMSASKGFVETASSQCIVNSPSPEDLDGIVGGFVVIEGEEGESYSAGARQETPRRSIEVNISPADILLVQEYIGRPIFSDVMFRKLVKKKDKMGNTLLHNAVEKGDRMDIIKVLLNVRGAIDIQNNIGQTPVHTAAATGKLDVLELFLECGVNMSVISNDGYTLLHEASISGQTDTVHWLLDHGADIEARGFQYRTPLHTTVIWCHLETVRLLLNHGAQINCRNIDGRTPLSFATTSKHKKIRELLISRGGVL